MENPHAPATVPGDTRPWQFWNLTDLHAGSEFAPNPKGSRPQRWLFRKWEEMIAHMAAESQMYRIRVGAGGEFTEKGLKSISLAVELFQPVMELADEVHLVRGTAWHTDDGVADTEVATILGITDLSEEIRFTLDGRHIWHTHHGPKPAVGVRGRANALNTAAADIYVDCLESGERIPDIWMYGHWHSPATGTHHYFDKTGTEHELKVVCCPPWQVKTRYGFKAVPFTPVPWIGAAVYTPSANSVTHHMWRVPYKYNRGVTR